MCAKLLKMYGKISSVSGNLVSEEADGYFVSNAGGYPDLIFGTGLDGDLTINNGEEKLFPYPAKAYHFNDLTINEGGILHPWAYYRNENSGSVDDLVYVPIIVNGTLTINGELSADGPNAVGVVGAGTYLDGIVYGYAKEGPGGVQSGGGDGEVSQADAEQWQTPVGDGYGFMGGGLGGGGGDGGGASKGSGYTPTPEYEGTFIKCPSFLTPGFFEVFTYYQSTAIWPIGGGGGGGGAGGGTNAGGTGGTGGGGGGGGGSIYIAARNIVIGSNGKISAKGGSGADGTNGVGGNASGGGGGGGGGGGLVYMVYKLLTNNGSIDVSPGLLGNGGSGVGSGVSGSGGINGSTGNIYKLNLGSGTYD